MSSPYTTVYWDENNKTNPIKLEILDPIKFVFLFAVDDAEALANQILAACQDYRETMKEKKNV